MISLSPGDLLNIDVIIFSTLIGNINAADLGSLLPFGTVCGSRLIVPTNTTTASHTHFAADPPA
jgi:hypothetical protein